MKGWFPHNWMYGGFIASLFLLALAPVTAAPAGLAFVFAYLQLPIYMLHQLEEHRNDRFRRWINDAIAGGREMLSTPAVIVINVVGVWLVDVIALYLAHFLDVGLGLIPIYLTIVNAAFHIVAGTVQRCYNPGLTTALLLFVPLGVWALIVVSAVPGVSATDHFIGLAAAVFIHAAIIGYARLRVAALAKGTA
jgi:hypothetical protein